jgi:carbon storage regulator
MLELTRKAGERVVVGEGIQITVVAINGNKVRLGFLAPEDVFIRREELCFDVLSLQEPDEPLPEQSCLNWR